MGLLAVAEAVAGGALLFVVPGFAVAKAVFPERRVRAADGVRWALELASLSLVLSVVLTVAVGYVLLSATPGGFSAAWSDPLLESALAAIALVAFVAGVLQGAYAREPPARPRPEPEPGGAGAWELAERLERLQRARLGVERQLAGPPAPSPETAAALRARRDGLLAEERELRLAREAEYDV